MKVRFQADADFSQIIVRAVRRREPAVDFRAAHEAGLRGLPDDEVLALAAGDGRVLVSHDRTTMPGHFERFVASAESAGLLIIRQKVSIHQALEEILTVWSETGAEDWVNQMRVV